MKDERPDRPGSFLWLMIVLVVIILSVVLCSCEESTYTDMRGQWKVTSVNYKIDITLFHSGTVMTGTGVLTWDFESLTTYDIDVVGNYFHPGVALTFVTKNGQEYRYDGDLLDNRTIQGKLNGETNLTFYRQ